MRQGLGATRVVLVLAVFVGLLFNLSGNQAVADMFGLFKKYDVHLSPEVRGQIMEGGKPVAGLKVSRSLTYGEERIDHTHTDEQGRFEFPVKWIRSGIPGRPMDETRNRQIVYAEREGKQFLLWYAVTDSIEPEAVVREKLGSMRCDLNTPEELQHFEMAEHPGFTHDVMSICRWKLARTSDQPLPERLVFS